MGPMYDLTDPYGTTISATPNGEGARLTSADAYKEALKKKKQQQFGAIANSINSAEPMRAGHTLTEADLQIPTLDSMAMAQQQQSQTAPVGQLAGVDKLLGLLKKDKKQERGSVDSSESSPLRDLLALRGGQ